MIPYTFMSAKRFPTLCTFLIAPTRAACQDTEAVPEERDF